MLKEGNKRQEHYVFGRNAEADRIVIEDAIGLSLSSIAQNVLSTDESLNPNFDGIVGEILVTLKMKHPKSTISPDYIRLMLLNIYSKLFLQSFRSVEAPATTNVALEEVITELVWEKSSIQEIIDYLESIDNKIIQTRGEDMYDKAIYFLRLADESLKKFGRIDEGLIANIPDFLDLRYKVESFNP